MHKTQMLESLEEVIPVYIDPICRQGQFSLGRIPPLLQTPAYSDTSWDIRTTPPPNGMGLTYLDKASMMSKTKETE